MARNGMYARGDDLKAFSRCCCDTEALDVCFDLVHHLRRDSLTLSGSIFNWI